MAKRRAASDAPPRIVYRGDVAAAVAASTSGDIASLVPHFKVLQDLVEAVGDDKPLTWADMGDTFRASHNVTPEVHKALAYAVSMREVVLPANDDGAGCRAFNATTSVVLEGWGPRTLLTAFGAAAALDPTPEARQNLARMYGQSTRREMAAAEDAGLPDKLGLVQSWLDMRAQLDAPEYASMYGPLATQLFELTLLMLPDKVDLAHMTVVASHSGPLVVDLCKAATAKATAAATDSEAAHLLASALMLDAHAACKETVLTPTLFDAAIQLIGGAGKAVARYINFWIAVLWATKDVRSPSVALSGNKLAEKLVKCVAVEAVEALRLTGVTRRIVDEIFVVKEGSPAVFDWYFEVEPPSLEALNDLAFAVNSKITDTTLKNIERVVQKWSEHSASPNAGQALDAVTASNFASVVGILATLLPKLKSYAQASDLKDLIRNTVEDHAVLQTAAVATRIAIDCKYDVRLLAIVLNWPWTDANMLRADAFPDRFCEAMAVAAGDKNLALMSKIWAMK